MSMLPVGFGASGDYTIEESLRFNASQSSYLSWTPASAGNRKTWTWSGWVKRGQLGAVNRIFSADDGSASTDQDYNSFFFNSSDQLQFGGNLTNFRITSSVYRDSSAWYHIVFATDTTQATAANRFKLYVNGLEVTSFGTSNNPSQNTDLAVNAAIGHFIGSIAGASYFDGYITEVNFIDGQALDASSFGETDATTGVWKPKEYTGTYGTNGFYLPMKLDNTVEGFNTVTWVGNGSTQQITGVGFSPDLVWIKSRSNAYSHRVFDSVRGATLGLNTNGTNAEFTESGVTSFDTDGFTLGSAINENGSGSSFVGWCWDAGSSTVSNTDGSITSSVRANPTYGFSVVSYTGNATNDATIGHGLGATPKFIIVKNRATATYWYVYHGSLASTYNLYLNDTASAQADNVLRSANSTTFTVSSSSAANGSSQAMIAYCFSEVSGYSKFGSYTGTGASGNVVTTGFKPAFVMIKRTDSAGEWVMLDNTRSPVNPARKYIYANGSSAEADAFNIVDFTDTGFTHYDGWTQTNLSGATYIYMAFADTREYAFWLDDSGNNNDWQPNGGITTSSTVTDTPTPYLGGGNYAVLNPLISATAGNTTVQTFSNANLKVVTPNTSYAKFGGSSTVGMKSGKWYSEITVSSAGGSYPNYTTIGITGDPWYNAVTTNASIGEQDYSVGYYNSGGLIRRNGSNLLNTGVTQTAPYTCMVALDVDAGKVYFGINGTWLNSADPSAGTGGFNILGVASTPSGQYFFGCYSSSSYMTATYESNFGQRPFAYTPPTGFKALHTGNLPDSSIVDGSKYFNAVLYTGNTSGASVTGIGFQPDFVWSKNRSVANNHELIDVVRGGSSALFSNLTNAEATQQRISSFDSDGWTYTTNSNSANTGQSFVGWNWKANGTGVTNTDGSITSTVSANPTAGFSIVSATAPSSYVSFSFGHGLGVKPAMVIYKERIGTANWWVWHQGLPNAATGRALNLNNTSGELNGLYWGTIDSSVVTSNATQTTLSAPFVAYCFAEVEGYSKFGSYLGNGSADGPFVYTGFRPAFVLRKCSGATGDWFLIDATRSPHNVSLLRLNANTSDAESSGANSDIDILSNGFKIRAASTAGVNQSGQTHIYMAFSENPFKNSLAR